MREITCTHCNGGGCDLNLYDELADRFATCPKCNGRGCIQVEERQPPPVIDPILLQLARDIVAAPDSHVDVCGEVKLARGIIAYHEGELHPWDRKAADTLADEVALLVLRGVLDSRSPAGDALLDYRNPPSSNRADRMAELERENEDLRRLAGLCSRAEMHAAAAMMAAELMTERCERLEALAGKAIETLNDIVNDGDRYYPEPEQMQTYAMEAIGMLLGNGPAATVHDLRKALESAVQIVRRYCHTVGNDQHGHNWKATEQWAALLISGLTPQPETREGQPDGQAQAAE